MKRDQRERLNICDKETRVLYSNGIPVSGKKKQRKKKQAGWLHTDIGDVES